MDSWYVTHLDDLISLQGPQRQTLTPAITTGKQMSCGFVVMPPGHRAAAHVHYKYDIIIVVLEGNPLSLLGEEMDNAIPHQPGDSILVPAGVPHAGINLSRKNRVVLVECRADPTFNEDVTLLPDLEERTEQAKNYYQERFQEPLERQNLLELL